MSDGFGPGIVDGVELDEFEMPLWRCSFLRGGTCDFGCVDEPACVTCEPSGGWGSFVLGGSRDTGSL